MPTYEDLRVISEYDPDNGDVEPTDADYLRFRSWVINVFGRETLDVYLNTYWMETSDV